MRDFDDDADWSFPLLENSALALSSLDQASPNLAGLFTLDDTVDFTGLGQPQNLDHVYEQGDVRSAQNMADFTISDLSFEHASLQPLSTYSNSSDVNSSKTNSPRNHGPPASLSSELIDLFFDHVQPWLPILHKTRFLLRYVSHLLNNDPFKNLASDEAFLLSSAFALAARYSSHEALVQVPAVERGQRFFETAGDYLSKCRALTSPTLAYLQGTIMYACYSYNCGVFLQGWVHTGICVQLAYELGLDNMDDEDSDTPQDMTWSEKEEMRRAWWLVWELDTFGSIVSSRPVMIDCTRMSVLLPVSDEHWFSDIETRSTRLLSDPGTCWKSLDRTENQSARAWFLVANHLMSLVQSTRQRKEGTSPEMQIRLENDISCMRLALPPSMSLEADCTNSDSSSVHDRNWVMGTHLMLLSASWYMRGIGARTSGASVSPDAFAFGKARLLSRWKPEHVATAHPFYTFLLVNPFSDHPQGGQSKDPISLSSCRDLSRLLLRQFAFKWTIGVIASSES